MESVSARRYSATTKTFLDEDAQAVTYKFNPSGSSAAEAQLIDGTIDFAALASRPTKKAMDAMPKLWVVPSVGGAVAIIFNVPGTISDCRCVRMKPRVVLNDCRYR